MPRESIIAWDVHSSFCEGGYIDSTRRERDAWATILALGLIAVARKVKASKA